MDPPEILPEKEKVEKEEAKGSSDWKDETKVKKPRLSGARKGDDACSKVPTLDEDDLLIQV